MSARTSLTHPLQIGSVAAPGGGLIGLTLCPGKFQPHAHTGSWARDLDVDLDAIKAWGAVAVVTLMETPELVQYRVPKLGESVLARGIEWHHLPIRDYDIPRAPFEERWTEAGPVLRAHLTAGRRILLHCLGGLGRSGTIAARLLIELGIPPKQAITDVRSARPHAIETDAQYSYVLHTQSPG